MAARIDLEQIREYMRRQSEEDKKNRTLTLEAAGIPEALSRASVELGLPLRSLEYEVLERGSAGTMGIGRRPWKIRIYEKSRQVKTSQEEAEEERLRAEEAARAPERAPDVAGEVFVRISSDGVLLKVTRPQGRGPRASDVMAFERLSMRGVSNYDSSLVSRVVKHADGEYVRVADIRYDPSHDATVSVDITDGEMKAVVVVTEPGMGGADVSADYLRSFLQSNGVVHGIKDDALADFEASPRYGRPVVVAEGTKAHDGADARVVLSFKGEREGVKLKERDGRVDFKEISRVENVVEGQVLATKVPAEPGQPGQTVTGRIIPAEKGKDCEINAGKNVKLSEDGLQALSMINGQVILLAGRINVEPIYTIMSDVDLHTGNILFLGTVVVRGNVEDGFAVKAAGDIEVFGSVGKCQLDAEGDIIVHQGIAAKTEGKIRCGKSLYSKFIEHAHVDAGVNVIVTDGIVHSQVDANKMILCQGKRAQIVGGRLRASEEINSKILGSVAGTETLLEVGYDPRNKERLVQFERTKREVEKSLEEVELNIKTLETLQKAQKTLPPEKAQYLTEQSEKRSQLLTQLDETNREIGKINTYLASLNTIGKISASERVYPGVKLAIKTAALAVRTEFKYVTFFLQSGEVKVTKYESFDEQLMRRR
ncbi:MAG TPA: FapA family protein [Spirochaetia bacterium]|nr:FapA family protein [Spirochaetia bacterium]